MEHDTLESKHDLAPYRALRSHFWLKGIDNIETHSKKHGRRLDYPDGGEVGAFFAALLVRDEYPVMCDWITRELKRPRYGLDRLRGLLVYGQTGIGKTYFLFYALVHFLSIGTPVAWCLSSYYWLLYDGEGVHFRTYDSSMMNDKTVALFNANPPGSDIYTPLSSCRALVVQASSDSSSYRRWTEKLRACFWVMSPWSLKEVKQEAAFRAVDFSPEVAQEVSRCYSPKHLWKLLGPTARECFTATRINSSRTLASALNLDAIVERMFEANRTHWESSLRTGEISTQFQCSGFDLLFTVFPNTPGEPTQVIPMCHAVIPTRYLRRLVFDRLREVQTDLYFDYEALFDESPQIVAIRSEARASNHRERKRHRHRHRS